MNQRLVWNFEFSTVRRMTLTHFVDEVPDELKWEQRFFWPDDQIIHLCTLDDSLLHLANYQQKHKEDEYYLLPKSNYNIKRRNAELVFKPLMKQTGSSFGFGVKINLDDESTLLNHEGFSAHELKKIAHQAKEKGALVLVKKESFHYKFPTSPTIKLELARLEIDKHIYFSACIEGKSLFLVETISKLLLGEQVSCDYVTFLKRITK